MTCTFINTSPPLPFLPARPKGSAWILLGALAALVFAGCAAPRPPGPPREPAQLPQLHARTLFFGDQIEATIELAAALPGKDLPPAGGGGGGGPSPGGGGGPPGIGPGGGIREGMQPVLRLTLDLANRTAEPQMVEALTFASELGDFAVRPERLALHPGQQDSVYPMFSRRFNGGDIVITLTLRKAGQIETQVLTLRPISPR